MMCIRIKRPYLCKMSLNSSFILNPTMNRNFSRSPDTNSRSPHKQKSAITFEEQEVPVHKSAQKLKRSRSSSRPSSRFHDDYGGYLQDLISDLSVRREKMESLISLFTLMQNDSVQARCLLHNNTLTLYCLTQRRILCVNCIYGVTKHRTHKVLPLKDCMEEVRKDNELLRGLIDADLAFLEQNIVNSHETTKMLEREQRKKLEKMEEEYAQQIDALKVKFAAQREQVKGAYEHIIRSSRLMGKGLEEFKFRIWQTISKVGVGKQQRNEANNNDVDVVRQIFCVGLSQITKLEVKKISVKQIDKLGHTYIPKRRRTPTK